jgi:hypothetical protein
MKCKDVLSCAYGMELTAQSAIAQFGAKAKGKLANPAVTGQPEDQLRSPFETLLADIALLCNFPKAAVSAVGESSLSSSRRVRTLP